MWLPQLLSSCLGPAKQGSLFLCPSPSVRAVPSGGTHFPLHRLPLHHPQASEPLVLPFLLLSYCFFAAASVCLCERTFSEDRNRVRLLTLYPEALAPTGCRGADAQPA